MAKQTKTSALFNCKQIYNTNKQTGNMLLLIDDNRQPHIVMQSSPFTAYPLDSAYFRNEIGKLYMLLEDNLLKETGKDPAVLTKAVMSDFIDWLSIRATNNPVDKLWLRTGYTLKKGVKTYFYNIGDGSHAIQFFPRPIGDIRAGRRGWKIVSTQPKNPIYFKSNIFIHPQVLPDIDGNIEDIFLLKKYLNVSDSLLMMLLVHLVASLHPTLSVMVLNIFGSRGSTKTTTLRLMKSLLDPSAHVSHPNKDARLDDVVENKQELMHKTTQNYCLYLDNLSSVPVWLSDALARIATGNVMSERQLYTTNDYIKYTDRPVLGLNGINLATKAPDLLQRSLLIEIDKPKKRISERDLWSNFHKDKPKILAGMFQAFSASLYEFYENNMDLSSRRMPRMVDYAKFGYHIAKCLGYTEGEYTQGLQINTSMQNTKGLESSPTGEVVAYYLSFILNAPTKMTVKDMHEEFKKVATDRGYEIGSRSGQFPSTVQKFGYELRKIIDDLEDIGYEIKKDKRTSAGIVYELKPFIKNKDHYMEIADSMN